MKSFRDPSRFGFLVSFSGGAAFKTRDGVVYFKRTDGSWERSPKRRRVGKSGVRLLKKERRLAPGFGVPSYK